MSEPFGTVNEQLSDPYTNHMAESGLIILAYTGLLIYPIPGKLVRIRRS
ncbi:MULTISPECIES: hypothetical protein [Chryseobacterium]|nr:MULTISPECIES: hypothetical protein [Chryseobacterium]WFB67928.1 hypothetical protein PZ898_00670 [Chryseobacterium sp. WX]